LSNKPLSIAVGARDSPLSRAQVREVEREFPHLVFHTSFIKTKGDLDRTTSLKTQEKSNFFTQELDELLLSSHIRLAIHSAKDLPDPLPKGLKLAYLTKGLDPRDALVGPPLRALKLGARVGTSSRRREEGLRLLRPDLCCVDIRGTIEERLSKMGKECDALVVAESALIRLGLTHLEREILPFEPAALQGRLALLIRSDDQEMLTCLKFSI
jgi:Porphobilinogen deaminase